MKEDLFCPWYKLLLRDIHATGDPNTSIVWKPCMEIPFSNLTLAFPLEFFIFLNCSVLHCACCPVTLLSGVLLLLSHLELFDKPKIKGAQFEMKAWGK